MWKTAILAIGLILGGQSAMAQNAPGAMHQQPLVNGPCAADRAKFCKNVQPGQGRIIGCLAAHKAQLAPACKERMAPAFKRLGQYKM